MTLAYAFWHAPLGTPGSGYERALAGFHTSLADDPPKGFQSSWTWSLPSPAWFQHAPRCYLDWYLVEDFSALAALNEAAVSGSRQGPHDRAAGLAGYGTAGLYRLLAGEPTAAPSTTLVFAAKPRGTAYGEALTAACAAAEQAGGSAWQRQMTLGPGLEYVIAAPRAPGLAWQRETLRARLVTG